MENYKIEEEKNVTSNDETHDNSNDNRTIANNINSEKNVKESIFNFKYAIPILAGNLLLILIMTILSIMNFQSLKEVNNKIIDLTTEMESIKNKVVGVENIKSDVDFLKTSLEEMRISSFLTQLSFDASEGVVTDKIVIQKVSLYSIGDIIYGYIDIRPQPSYNSYFQGQGKFNLSDREIKAMIEEVMVELKDYMSSISMYNLKMEGGTLDITANNYSVAQYIDGKVILAGE
jgi:hypothetical protein